jgi:hypothetical protein
VCVCFRVFVSECVQSRGRVRTCARASVAFLIQHATVVRQTLLSFVVSLDPSYFSTLSQNGTIFVKTLLNTKCVF